MSCHAQTAAVPFLSPRQENLLEYELIRAINRVTLDEKKIIGVISAFPVLGRKANPATGQQPSARWTVFEELAKDYHLFEIPQDLPEIPDGIDAILVFHPSGISAKTLYALDQYLMRGGNLGVFLDPDSAYARANIRRDYSMLDKQSSDFGPLLSAWGIAYDKNILSADMIFKLDRIASNGTRQVIPTVLNVDHRGINKDIGYLKGLSAVRMNFTGAFPLLQEIDGLNYERLLFTTDQAKLVSVNDSPEKVFADFQDASGKDPDYRVFPLAWHISGKFSSAYPNGAPDAAAILSREHLMKAEKRGSVFLFGDTDMLFHDACVTVHTDEFNQQELLRSNDNLTLLQNIADELTQSLQLAELRSRIPMNRPLTKVNESKLKADLKYKDHILALGLDFNKMQKQVELLNKYVVANGGQ